MNTQEFLTKHNVWPEEEVMQKDLSSVIASETAEKDREIERLRKALDKIDNPIKHIQQDAEKDGAQVNGLMALQMSNDVFYLKTIAREALKGGKKS